MNLQNILSNRYATVRLHSWSPCKGTLRPVSLGENFSIVLAPSQHVFGKHSPIGVRPRSTR